MVPDHSKAAFVTTCLGAGVLGGLLLACYFWLLEHFWYHLFRFLEKKKLIQRLAPHIPITAVDYSTDSFWAVAASVVLPLAIVFAGRKGCFFSLDFIGAWRFTWITMVFHDAFFWVVHTILHKVKILYRNVHQLHHSTFGGITTFSSAYGTVLDTVIPFTPFLCWLTYNLCLAPEWNLFHLAIFLVAITNVHVLGHSGYRLPAWIYVPGSLGISLTPGAQRPIHHYIHHLDPRLNRSLYFTWCDRIAGTFAGRMKWEDSQQNYLEMEMDQKYKTT